MCVVRYLLWFGIKFNTLDIFFHFYLIVLQVRRERHIVLLI